MIDIQLEAFNILAGAAAYSFFDIGLKIWEPLAKMGISYIPKDMKSFRKALYMKKMKIYEKKFSADSAEAEDEDEEEADGAFWTEKKLSFIIKLVSRDSNYIQK